MTIVPSRRRFLAASAGLSAAMAGGGLLLGGAGPAAAAAPPTVTCAGDPAHPKRQLRGVWIASVSNINWPSAPGLTAAQQQAELTGLLDAAVRTRMNAVYLQIRPAADALYASPHEPWSQGSAQCTAPMSCRSRTASMRSSSSRMPFVVTVSLRSTPAGTADRNAVAA